MTSAEPLDLPGIDPEALSTLNALAGTGRSLSLAVGNDAFNIRFTPAPASPSGTAASILFGGRPIWLTFSDWNQFATVAELLDGEPLDRVPTAILPAVLSAAFDKNLDQLAQISGAPCQIDAVTAVDQLPPGLQGIGIEFESAEGKAISGCILSEIDALSLLRDAMMRVAPTAARTCRQLPLTAGIEIGLTQLAFEELRTLGRGDVVLFDVAAPRDKPSGLLRFAPTASWRASLGNGRATLLEPVRLAHWGRDAATGRTVTLVFEQGRVEITAEQVAGLQAGAELPCVAADEITIRNGGQLIGTGELVWLAGRTGVRIDSWPAR